MSANRIRTEETSSTTSSQFTPFPSLSSAIVRDASQLSGNDERENSDYGILKHTLESVTPSPLQTADDIIKAFVRFISSFTGQSDVVFEIQRLSGTGDLRSSCVSATCEIDASATSTASARRSPAVQTQQYDWADVSKEPPPGFCLILTGAHGELQRYTSQAPFCVALSENDKSNLSLRYKKNVLPDTLARSVLGGLVRYLGFESGAEQRSVSNYPPRSRPRPFRQDRKGDEGLSEQLPALLHSAFERRAQQFPDRIALDFMHAASTSSSPQKQDTLSYAELDSVTNILASQICVIFSKPTNSSPRIVPFCASTSISFYVSWLGILKAGCAMCPIPLDAPSTRIHGIFDEFNPTVSLGRGPRADQEILRSDDASRQTQLDNMHWIDVDDLVSQWRSSAATSAAPKPDISIAETDLAYVMYTSGSTGNPKGVQISHFAATSAIASHEAILPDEWLAQEYRWFQMAPTTFDPSVVEIFLTWATGGTLCSSPRDLTLTDTEGTISALRANIAFTTPSLASVVRPQKVPSLSYLWVSGELINQKVIKSFARDSSERAMDSHEGFLPFQGLTNLYGPTEAAVNCTAVSDVSVHERRTIIGPALETCSLFILDPDDSTPSILPLGFTGELAIGGPQLSIGYLNRPDLTAKAFVDSEDFGKLYRTGDRARLVHNKTADIVVDFMGRLNDDQVKLSGRRTELGDIEAAFSSIEGLREIAAVVFKYDETKSGSERPVACVGLLPEADVDTVLSRCRECAEASLPTYMRPAEYFVVESLPRMSSGKVKRSVLQELFKQHRQSTRSSTDDADVKQTANIEHEDEITITIRQAISELTGVATSSFAADEPLIILGIDSLQTVRLLQILRDRKIMGLSVGDVLQGGTLNKIVARYRSVNQDTVGVRRSWVRSNAEAYQHKYKAACEEKLHISSHDITRVLPTTATQTSVLASFTKNQNTDRKTFIQHSIYRVRRQCDYAALEAAWIQAISDADIYRTVFVEVDDDLSPFAQCTLTSEAKLADPGARVRRIASKDSGEPEECIQQAKKAAEAAISLESPPWILTFVQSGQGLAVMLSQCHAIFDGGSLELLQTTVGAHYQGKLPEPATSVDVAVDRHFSADQPSAATYWKSQFEDFTPSQLPCVSYARPQLMHFEPMVTERTADCSYMALLDGAKQLASSPLAVLQAAWSLLLITYNGSSTDVAFGSIVSDRLDAELTTCVALTHVIVPFRVKVAPNSTVSGLLGQLTQKNAESLYYLHTPLDALRTANGALLYDTTLAFQAFGSSSQEESFWEALEIPAMNADVPIMLEITPRADGQLQLRITYKYNRLDPDAAAVLLKQLDSMISWLLRSPDASFLDGRSALSEDLLSISPVTDRVSARNTSSQLLLHDLFQRNLCHSASRPSLEFKAHLDHEHDDVKWTYEELNEKAESLSRQLVHEYGSLWQKVIPICMEKCPELYIAILALLKAGAAWCSIDAKFPANRKRELIQRTGGHIVLVVSDSLSGAILDGVTPVDLTNNKYNHAVPAGYQEASTTSYSVPPTTADDTAYMIFTSGTTGPPKGVPISHRSAVAAMEALAKAIPTDVHGDQVRCLQFSRYTFDVFVQDLFYTWAVGGAVISSTHQILLNSVKDLANVTQVTHAHLTPAFAETLSRKEFDTLQVVTMIGEKLTQSVADDWGQNMRAYNTYGPAECTVVSTLRRFGAEGDVHYSSNIGAPLPTVGTYVLKDDRPVLRGGLGELALSGVQLSHGYFKNPEMTAKKFVFNEWLKEKVYHTGDIVRQLSDGTIEYVGRDDDLVKISGIRMELSEIAFSIQESHASVTNAAALLCSRTPGSAEATKILVAFIVCAEFADSGELRLVTGPDASRLAREISTAAQADLPEAMLPNVYLLVNRIPHSASNKIDRKALVELMQSAEVADWEKAIHEGSQVPAQEDESWKKQYHALVTIIADLTGASAESIGPASRFTSLGIDSIRAIRLVSRLKKLGHPVSVMDVLSCHSLSDLSARLSSSSKAGSDGKKRIAQFDRNWHDLVKDATGMQSEFSLVPTLLTQENILSETLRSPQAYWVHHMFALDKDVDLGRLRNAWTVLARGNEVFRTGFVPKANIPSIPQDIDDAELTFLQIIYTDASVDWTEVNTGKDVDEAARSRAKRLHDTHQENMLKGPLWAVTILKQEGTHQMMFSIHHSVFDGPSLDFVVRDLRALYDSAGVAPARAQLRHAVTILSDPTPQGETNKFWTQALRGFGAEKDSSEPGKFDMDSKTNKGAIIHRTQHFDGTTSYDDLRQVSSKFESASASTIIRIAWSLLLAELLENEDLLLGEVIGDRSMHPDLATAIGPLVSTVPIPFKSAQGTVGDVITEHSSLFRAIMNNRSVRPRLIKKLIGQDSADTLYPALYIFNSGSETSAVDEESISLIKKLPDVLELSVEHPLALNVWPRGDRLYYELSIDETKVTAEQQHLLCQQLDALISAIVRHPDQPVKSLTSYFPDELLSITPPKALPNFPVTVSPTYWIEHWAATHPNWKAAEIAFSFDESGAETVSWTYGELNEAAERVACFLRNRGIVRRSIGMCVGRTLWAFAITIGIMKSGNVYVPIEENFPPDRKTFLLQDSNAAILFSTPELFTDTTVPESCAFVDVSDEKVESVFSEAAGSEMLEVFQEDLKADAYLLYTSGSTGKPKGVLVNRGNLSAFSEAQSNLITKEVPATIDLAGKGAYLCLASRAFDPHIGEMFLAWRHGLSATSASRTLLLDDLALGLTLLKISHASFVPSLLDHTGITPEEAPHLHYIGVGGEKMSQKTKKLWGGHDRVRLINAYGPTEATIGCCSGRVLPESDVANIGKPLGDSRAFVLVPGTEIPVKRGMPGELCFTGSLIATGYHNRPDATGFVENFHGMRMYRTGDIVRMMTDTSIQFLGRKDDQVKIRGQRVELGEVSEGVRVASTSPIDVASLVLKHPDMSRLQLVAFVAASKSTRPQSEDAPSVLYDEIKGTNESLRPACKSMLAAFMVPDLIVPLSYIPLAATSGKADNKLLTKSFFSIPVDAFHFNQNGQSNGTASGDTKSQRELSQEEITIRDIIKAVVPKGVENVGPYSTLFELGVDSLAAISIFSKLRMAGYSCSVAKLMQNPTLEDVARFPKSSAAAKADRDKAVEEARLQIAELKQDFLKREGLPVSKDDVEDILPCMPLQETLAVGSLSGTGETSYINNILLQLEASADLEKLESAFQASVEDNSILRTCFVLHNDQVLQVVLKPEAAEQHWRLDFSLDDTLADGDQYNVIADMHSQDITKYMTTKAPLRLAVWQSPSSERFFACLSLHHALYDGISLASLFHELGDRYAGEKVQSRPQPKQMLEYVATLDSTRAKNFWSSTLSGWERTRLLSESQDTALQETSRTFSKTISQLEDMAKPLNITVATLLQGAFAIALAQSLEVDDLVFGNVLSGRAVPIEDADQLLLPCIATIPQRAAVREFASDTMVDFLKALQSTGAQSLEYQHTSPREIQKWIGANRPLYDCLFSFIKIDGAEAQRGPWTQVENSITVDYALAIEFEADSASDTLKAGLGFTSAFGDLSRAEEFLEKVEILAEYFARDGTLAIQDIGITAVPTSSSISSSEGVSASDDGEWTTEEEELRGWIAEFCDVPRESVRKQTLFIHLGVDSIVAIRLSQFLRKKGLKVSSAMLIRNGCIRALVESKARGDGKSSGKKENIGNSNGMANGNANGNANGHVNSHSNGGVNGANGSLQQSTSEELLAQLTQAGLLSTGNHIEHCYVCTPLQSGMVTQTIAADGKLYVHHHVVALTSSVSVLALKNACATLVRDHDILRTSYWRLDTKWIAVVGKSSEFIWKETDTDNTREELARLTGDMRFEDEVSFTKVPLAFNIIKSDTETLFSVSMHHSLYDGISVVNLFGTIAQYLKGAESLQHTPFFKAAEEISSQQDAAVDFWAKSLHNYESIEIPKSPGSDRSSPILRTQIVEQSLDEISEICQKQSFTIQDACLLAFGKALARLVGRRDVVFGQVLAGRTLQLEGADEILGPLFNTVPFRVKLSNALAINKHAAREIRDLTTRALEYQHASLAEVQKLWRQQSGSTGPALIDSLFTYQKSAHDPQSTESPLWEPIDEDSDIMPSEYRLNFEIEQTPTQLIARSSARVSDEQLDMLMRDFDDALKDILHSPSRFVTAVPSGLADLPAKITRTEVSEYDSDATSAVADVLRGAMSEVCGVPKDGIELTTSIFSIGLDSIAAIQVAQKCRRKGFRVSAADVISGVTMGRICELVYQKKQAMKVEGVREEELTSASTKEAALKELGLHADGVEDILPLLPGQEWHLAGWLKSGKTSYEPAWTLRATRELDTDMLSDAWERLIERHPILRTTCVATQNDSAVQVVLKTKGALMSQKISFSAIESLTENLADATSAAVRKEVHEPSDLFSPPVRLRHIKAHDGHGVLIMVHHALYDAFSMPRMIAELASLYLDQPLEPTSSFSTFIKSTFQQSHQSTEAEKSFWSNSLATLQPTHLPITQTPHHQSFVLVHGSSLPIVPAEQKCRQHNIALHHVLLVAFARVLARLTSSPSPLFGFYQHGRSVDAENPVAGPCMNMLPLGLPNILSTNPRDAAKAVQQNLSARTRWEQSRLLDVLRHAGLEGDVLPFNVFINLLFRRDVLDLQANGSGSVKEKELFEALPIGVPSDFAPKVEVGGKSAVERLREGELVRRICGGNLFVDVGPRADGEALDWGVRCEGAFAFREGEEGGWREFVGLVEGEVKAVLEEL